MLSVIIVEYRTLQILSTFGLNTIIYQINFLYHEISELDTMEVIVESV